MRQFQMDDCHIFMMESQIAAEVKRLEKLQTEKTRHLQGARGKLGNANFVEKAPAEVVQQQRDMAEDLQKQIATLEGNLAELRQAR